MSRRRWGECGLGLFWTQTQISVRSWMDVRMDGHRIYQTLLYFQKKPFTSMIPYIKNKCLLLPLWATNAGESRLVWYEFACGANNFALPYAESLHISSIFRQNLKLRSGCSCSNVRLCCFVCFFVFWTARCTKQDIYRDFLELWEPGIDIFKISTKQRINNRSKIKQISSSGQWKNERSHRKAS